MNPYHGQPVPYGVPMMPPASNVLSAPPMMHPPMGPGGVHLPYVQPPNWQQRLVATPATQPLTVYIGKIPEDLDNSFLLKLLEACGPVQKWNRPDDITTGTAKAFGFCTFSQGTSALRCKNVLDGLELFGGILQVKAGTKEQTALTSIAAAERAGVAGGEEVDTNALLDAPLRERVYRMIERRMAGEEDDEVATQSGETADGEELDDREKQVLSEINKFRARQAERDKEVERRRAERIAARLKEMENQQGSAPVTVTQSDDKKKVSEGKHKEKERERSKRDPPQQEEDPEAKRRRKQQVLAMLGESGEESSATPSQDVPLSRPSGKLVIKSAKPARRTGAGGFADDDDEEASKKQRAIIPIDYTEEEKQSVHFASEQQAASFLSRMERETDVSKGRIGGADAAKKLKMKELVDSIPTNKDALFSHPVNWEACQKYNVVEGSMRSWVTKKFIEYLGEEEPTLTNFILTKISRRCHPEELLKEMKPVLDTDAESFVLKLWRMLIFNVLKADMDAGQSA